MQLTARRITVGVLSSAVVASLAATPSWAFAQDTTATSTPVHLIVGYRKGGDFSTAVQLMNSMGARRSTGAGASALGAVGATAVQVPASRSASLVARLKADPGVSYVGVDHVRKTSEVTPNDPLYPQQPELREVNLPAAWGVTTGSAVKVAVIDTGVTSAGDLAGAVSGGYDFVNLDTDASDDFGHGTTVASLIAARGNNEAGMAGVCWSCQILPVKVLDSSGSGYDSTIAQGIIFAVHQGAKIINMSLGGPDYSKVLADAVGYANDNNVLVVAAAGNENTSQKSYPAAYGDVLAVGATDPGSTTRAQFSNYNLGTNKWVDVAAPGTVLGLEPDGQYYTGETGTSFSAPLVSGIAALVKTYRPSYTGWSLMYAIESSTTNIGTWVTHGKVDAAKALTIGTDTTKPTSSGISPTATYAKVRGTVTITPVGLKDNYSGIRKVELFVDGVWKTWTKTAPYSVKWNSAGRYGNVHLRLRIYDKAGNLLYLDRTVVADNVAPTVKVTKAPKSGSKIKGTVKVYYTGSDKYGIKYYQLLVNGKVIQQHQTTKVPFTVVASKYPKTKIKVQLRVYDLAGNSKTTSALSYHR